MLGLIDRACRWATAAAIAMMVVLVVSDAIGRGLRMPVAGAVEVTEEYLMVAIVFLAMGFTHLEGRHIRIELFERWIPVLGGAFVKIAIEAISLVYFALIAWQGMDQARGAFAIDKRSTSELNYPMGPAYALVGIGCVVMCLWLARDIVALARGKAAVRPHNDADPLERPQE
jgi:TRAP-type C4-dicarboxylate transport system permease small subunit